MDDIFGVNLILGHTLNLRVSQIAFSIHATIFELTVVRAMELHLDVTVFTSINCLQAKLQKCLIFFYLALCESVGLALPVSRPSENDNGDPRIPNEGIREEPGNIIYQSINEKCQEEQHER